MKTKRGPGRPKLPKGEHRIAVKFRLHPTQAKKLRETAKNRNVSMGKLVGQLIELAHPSDLPHK